MKENLSSLLHNSGDFWRGPFLSLPEFGWKLASQFGKNSRGLRPALRQSVAGAGLSLVGLSGGEKERVSGQ
jgi:hypothetical protein